jgi:tetratricopeptide (TPR) repeat protein
LKVETYAATPEQETGGGNLESLLQRVAELEQRQVDTAASVDQLSAQVQGPDLSGVPDEELLSRAMMLYNFKTYPEAIRCFETLLAREHGLDPEKETRAYNSLGFAYRASGQEAKAEKTLRRLISLRGEESEDGMSALYFIAHSRNIQKDTQGARDLMDRVSQSPHSPAHWKLWSRANSADWSIALGEVERGRAALQVLKVELAEDDSQLARAVEGYVDRILKRLDAQ